MDGPQILERLSALIAEGEQLVVNSENEAILVPRRQISSAAAWLTSTAGLIWQVAPQNSPWGEQAKLALESSRQADRPADVPIRALHRMLGVVKAVHEDWSAGLLNRIEYVYLAATFDRFLDHAEKYHKGGHKKEAAVLASAVLEDGVRKVCEKNGIEWEGRTLFPRIEGLLSARVITQPEATRLKRWAEIRNKADHAEWEKIDARDVGMLIEGVREFAANFL
jgi:hypothetical protein